MSLFQHLCVLTLFKIMFKCFELCHRSKHGISLTDCETDLPPSDPSEPSADNGPRAAGAAGWRSEPGAPGCTSGPGGPRCHCCRRQGQAVLPLVASPLPVGRLALWPAHAAGTVWQVRLHSNHHRNLISEHFNNTPGDFMLGCPYCFSLPFYHMLLLYHIKKESRSMGDI